MTPRTYSAHEPNVFAALKSLHEVGFISGNLCVPQTSVALHDTINYRQFHWKTTLIWKKHLLTATIPPPPVFPSPSCDIARPFVRGRGPVLFLVKQQVCQDLVPF